MKPKMRGLNEKKLGLSSLLFPKAPIEDIIKFSAGLGAKCVEVIFDIPHFPPDFNMKELDRLRELINSHELEVAVHASIWDINPASHYREIKELATAQVKKSIDACYYLGGEVVVAHPGHCPVMEVKALLRGARERYSEFVKECWRHAQERGVTFTIENIDRADFPYSTVDEIKLLAREFDGLGITFDIGHAYLARRREGSKVPEKEIAEAIKKAGGDLVHIHIHDNKGLRDDHLPPGDGNIDFKPIVSTLKSMRYGGRLVAELWDPKNPLETGRRGLENIRKLLGPS